MKLKIIISKNIYIFITIDQKQKNSILIILFPKKPLPNYLLNCFHPITSLFDPPDFYK